MREDDFREVNALAFAAKFQQRQQSFVEDGAPLDVVITIPNAELLAEAGLTSLPSDWGAVNVGSLLADDRSIAVGVMYPGGHNPFGIPRRRGGRRLVILSLLRLVSRLERSCCEAVRRFLVSVVVRRALLHTQKANAILPPNITPGRSAKNILWDTQTGSSS